MTDRPTEPAAEPATEAAADPSHDTPRGTSRPMLIDAVEHLREGRIDDAEPLLQSLLERDPQQPDALHFLGVLRHLQGRHDEAVDLIRRSLQVMPDNATAWNNLGNVLLGAGRIGEVADAYEHAVAHAESPGEAVLALNNLGTLRRRLDELERSEAAIRQALARDPSYGDAWHNLSLTLLRLGRTDEAEQAQRRATTLQPDGVQPRHDAARGLMQAGELERAAQLLREWIAESPEGNPVAAHLLAACESRRTGQAPSRAADGYVEQVFDGFAASFDSRLATLGYRAPGLVAESLHQAVGDASGQLDICDAGVGTGLCGAGIRPYAKQLVGCDLSQGMLERAAGLGLYDSLVKAELTQFLAARPWAFDAVVSADTLCYFGALDEVATAAHRSLRPGGWLVFTVEALPHDDPPHVLQANGRYAHAQGHVRQALEAAGFDTPTLRPDTLRTEAGEPVHGWVVRARRPVRTEGAPPA